MCNHLVLEDNRTHMKDHLVLEDCRKLHKARHQNIVDHLVLEKQLKLHRVQLQNMVLDLKYRLLNHPWGMKDSATQRESRHKKRNLLIWETKLEIVKNNIYLTVNFHQHNKVQENLNPILYNIEEILQPK